MEKGKKKAEEGESCSIKLAGGGVRVGLTEKRFERRMEGGKGTMKKRGKSDAGRDFPGGPVAKTPCSQCRGPRFDPWSGNKIPHAAAKSRHSQINK